MKTTFSVARLMIPATCLIVGLFCWFSVRTVSGDFNKWERAYPECPDGSECRQLAKLFVTDYSETKDLTKSFLTLLVAVFVASITFSEKIVDVHKSGGWPTIAMISCWVSLLLAVIACGTGVGYMVIAYGMSVYAPESNYRFHEARAVQLFIASGVSFGVGLCTMLLAGLNTLVQSAPTVQVPVGETASDQLQVSARSPESHTTDTETKG
jgi:hypothetical protein